MPDHTQITVDPPATIRDLGRSDTDAMIAHYPSSPIHNGDLTRETVQVMGQRELIEDLVNDGGHTFGEFDRDYSGEGSGPAAPNMADVQTDNLGNDLSSPFAPSLASPPGGVDDWANQPATPEQTERAGLQSSAPFNGDGLASPSDTSINVAAQTIGSLRKGTSTPS